MALFDRSHTSSYSSSIETMAVSCAVFEIKRDIGRKSPIYYHTPLYFNQRDPMNPFEFLPQNLIQHVRVTEQKYCRKVQVSA